MLTKIGITGGIGSGKSEVCKKFASLGINVLSADSIARQLTDSDPAIRKKITALFGAESYDVKTGAYNSSYIAQRAFGDQRLLASLNSIVHPAVFEFIETALAPLRKDGKRMYIVVEAALMFESGLNKKMDYVLTVVSADSNRIERIQHRDNLTEEQIRLRMTHQILPDQAVTLSDFVLYNNESADKLQEKVIFLNSIFSTLTPRVKK